MSESKKYTPPNVAIQAGDIVFIDTCIFDSFKYSFDSPTFKSFAAHRASLGFVVVISAVVEREVLSHIERDYAGLQSRADQFDDSIGSDYSSDFEPLISQLKLQAAAAKESVLAAWEKFKENLGVVVLPFDLVTVQDIFDRYFDVSPPFDAKTKEEFPDAFSAIAIEKYQAQCGANQIVIISTDGIFSKCGELYPNWFVFKRILEFLESITRNQPAKNPTVLVASTSPDKPAEDSVRCLEQGPVPAVPEPSPPLPVAVEQPIAPVKAIQDSDDEFEVDPAVQIGIYYESLKRVVELNKDKIEEAIYEYVENINFEVHGSFQYENEQVEVSSVRLDSFRIDEVNINDQQARISVDVALDACVSFSCSTWDSIDREYIYLDSSGESISGEYSGFIEILFDGEEVDVVEVEFEALNGLAFAGELSDSFYE